MKQGMKGVTVTKCKFGAPVKTRSMLENQENVYRSPLCEDGRQVADSAELQPVDELMVRQTKN